MRVPALLLVLKDWNRKFTFKILEKIFQILKLYSLNRNMIEAEKMIALFIRLALMVISLIAAFASSSIEIHHSGLSITNFFFPYHARRT